MFNSCMSIGFHMFQVENIWIICLKFWNIYQNYSVFWQEQMIISLYSTPRSVTEKMLELMKHPARHVFVVVCFVSFKFRTSCGPYILQGWNVLNYLVLAYCVLLCCVFKKYPVWISSEILPFTLRLMIFTSCLAISRQLLQTSLQIYEHNFLVLSF
jgi:hypothetical protein